MLRSFASMPPADRWLLLEAVVLVAAIKTSLRIFSVRRVHQVLRACLPQRQSSPLPRSVTDGDRVRELSRIVDRASRHTVANTCLHRSLALWWLLGRRSIESDLRLGARRRNGRFEAHAWVEYGGEIVNDDGGEGDYSELPWMPLKYEA